MAKFLLQGSYTAEGAKGVLKEGGSGRKAAIEKALASVGGSADAVYYTFGASELLVICDVPDNVTALAVTFAANASGSLRFSTTPLLSIEGVDAATKKAVPYRPAGA